jgi:hypothetical protein
VRSWVWPAGPVRVHARGTGRALQPGLRLATRGLSARAALATATSVWFERPTDECVKPQPPPGGYRPRLPPTSDALSSSYALPFSAPGASTLGLHIAHT